MSKKVKKQVRLQLQGGSATPGPPVGSMLGPTGASGMDFCKQFNAATASRKGETVPVVITVYTDRSFTFVTKTSPVTELLRKRAKSGVVTLADIDEVANIKMEDLNAWTLESARKIILGSAKSMGLVVE
jgi:large subunit ribosomal protein L11